jgi:2-amino-4-hydroxy-6-hydroxymethyldihydropteridine diphosphokinase
MHEAKLGIVIFLGIGTNQGDRDENMETAVALINASVGEILAVSGVYETDPWGFESDSKFLNSVVKVTTRLSPLALLKKLQEIEEKLGRIRSLNRYSSRTIDIDILLYGSRIIRKKMLTVPHPCMPERRFVLVPLCDIEPEGIHPVLEKTFSDLLKECTDSGIVTKYDVEGMKRWMKQPEGPYTESAVS